MEALAVEVAQWDKLRGLQARTLVAENSMLPLWPVVAPKQEFEGLRSCTLQPVLFSQATQFAEKNLKQLVRHKAKA
jgi:hypothetical protein